MMRRRSNRAPKFAHSKNAALFVGGWNFSRHFHIILAEFFRSAAESSGSGEQCKV